MITPERLRWHVAIDRLRWRIADAVNRHVPGQCWAGLVSWALGHNRRMGSSVLPWRPITDTCRSISPPNDRCYCGNLTRKDPSA
jgi:hypothetical protein